MKFMKTVVQIGIIYSVAMFTTVFSFNAAVEAWENRDEIVASMKDKAGRLSNKIRESIKDKKDKEEE